MNTEHVETATPHKQDTARTSASPSTVEALESFGLEKEQAQNLMRHVLNGANIVISGATRTRKTTLLNLLLGSIDETQRIVCEDTDELVVSHFFDATRLSFKNDAWSKSYDHLLRVRPDYVILDEINTDNAYAGFHALNSGVTGFMCTIDAESPLQALNHKFEQCIKIAGHDIPNVTKHLHELVDVVVQIKRSPDGMCHITELYEPRAKTWVLKDSTTKPPVAG